MEKIGSLKGIDFYKTDVLVIGSGAASLNAINLLKNKGIDNATLITEGLKCGTSRNTGSDKQTYYKLSLSGTDKDSVKELAEDLYKGGAVDGDIALCEAALSAEGFYRLVELGVPFPKNRYGEYIGYKTDHDPHKRATSAGPYTSKFMVEALINEAIKNKVTIVENLQFIKLAVENNIIKGALFLNRIDSSLTFVAAEYVIAGTGGPGGIYKNSVYPESQFGATGILFDAGAKLVNVTEWQYGLASVKPRWNVSGSYMQVLPRFVSIDKEGIEYEFLFDYPMNEYKMLSNIFFKGYQWPFDVRKILNGSSIVDVLVYLELEKGRRVYLDFTKNRCDEKIDFEKLDKEAFNYLKSSKALENTPIKRLKKLNEPAYFFYLDKNIDLEKEYLEISLSSQHNNGGVEVDLWWESSIKNLFVVGEAAGTHGVYRPGGSALNSGQVGSRRAVEMIEKRHSDNTNLPKIAESNGLISKIIEKEKALISSYISTNSNVNELYDKLKSIMSIKASVIREEEALKKALEEINELEAKEVTVENTSALWLIYEFKNAIITSKAYVFGMLEYIKQGGDSRGSALYSKKDGSLHPEHLDARFRFDIETKTSNEILEVFKENKKIKTSLRTTRPIPQNDDFFEIVWAEYRNNKNIY